MLAYASRTGTRRNLRLLREAGWRLLIAPVNGGQSTMGFRYCLDNGAWSAFQQKKPWDETPFIRMVDKLGAQADFVVAPDIVGGGMASLERTLAWLPHLLDCTQVVLVAVQDGMEAAHVVDLLGPRVGVFVGGSTDFKLRTLAGWCALARSRNAWAHVGRVNSAVRINRCLHAGATSFDGTSASRYAVTLPKLDNARRQTILEGIPW